MADYGTYGRLSSPVLAGDRSTPVLVNLLETLLIMRPHPQNFYRILGLNHLVHQTMLNVDSP